MERSWQGTAGLLAALVLSLGCQQPPGDKVIKVKNDFAAIETACNMFRTHHDRWPDSFEELLNPPVRANGLQSQTYLKKLPKDPWSAQPYHFELDNRGPVLTSYGADRRAGGEWEDADITNRHNPSRGSG